MVAGGKSKEADPARCRRHPRHRHSAGVCPFCLRDRLSRLSAAAARADAASANANAAFSASSSSSTGSSPCASWEESVAPPAAPPRRRERLGMLLQLEGREAAVLGAAARVEAVAAAVLGAAGGVEAAAAAPEVEDTESADKKAKRGNFWARLQQQLHHGGWHRKDGCSVAHSRTAAAEKSAAAVAARPRRAPVV